MMIIDKEGLYIVVGENGSGKTTFFKEIQKKYIINTSMMTQSDEQILENVSVMDNITLKSAPSEIVIEFLKKFDLMFLLEKKSKFLSGGEKRLVVLLRTILSEKKIIILDEPSNDLDINMFEKAKSMIEYISQFKIVFLISHDDRFNNNTLKFKMSNNKLHLNDIIVKHLEISLENSSTDKKESKILINKNRNYVIYIFFCISILVFSLFLISMFNISGDENPIEKEDNIYFLSSSFSTNYHLYIDNESINTSLIQAATKLNKMDYFKKQEKYLKEGKPEYLELKEKSSVRRYNLEYFDEEQNLYIDMRDEVSKYLLGEDSFLRNTITFDENSYFKNKKEIIISIENTSINATAKEILTNFGYIITFDNELPNDEIILDFSGEVYDLLNQKNSDLKVLEAVVDISENNFVSFINDNNLWDKNVFIKGYEPELINREIFKLSSEISLIRKSFLFSILIISLLIIIIYINESQAIYENRILYYYGYSKKSISDFRKHLYGVKGLTRFTLLITMISLVSLLIYFQSFLVLLLPIIEFVYFLIYKIYLNKCIMKRLRRDI